MGCVRVLLLIMIVLFSSVSLQQAPSGRMYSQTVIGFVLVNGGNMRLYGEGEGGGKWGPLRTGGFGIGELRVFMES